MLPRRPFLLTTLALALALASSARADTLVEGLTYDGVVAGGGAQPMSALVVSVEGGTFDVLLDGPVGTVSPSSVRITLSAGAFAEVPFTFTAPAEPGVVDVSVVVRRGATEVDRYPHRVVVDWPELSDAAVAAAGIRALDGTLILTKRQLAEEFAPVARLSTPGAIGNDERFLPLPVEAGYRSARLRRRHPVSAVAYVFPPFDTDPAREIARNVGREVMLDLKGQALARDTPDDAVALQAALTGVQPAVYATVVEADGLLTVQYWFFYLYNDWTNDHECDWEQLTVAFDGVSGSLEPAWVAGSRHQDGTWRAWSKAPKFIDLVKGPTQHPLAYVANGGHGVYAWSGDDLMALGNDNHDGTLTELTPAGLTPSRPDATELSVRLAPRLSNRSDPAFGWLAFSGHWGYWDGSTDFLHSGTQGPPGPAFRAGGGVTASRPSGEMWLFPRRWYDHGKGGDALGMDAEGDRFQNGVAHTLAVSLTGDAPALDADRTYACSAEGTTRTGEVLGAGDVRYHMVAQGPGVSLTGHRSLTVRLDRGGRLSVECVAASAEGDRAYALGMKRLDFVICPAATELSGFECRCIDGYTSPDPSRVDCTKAPEPVDGPADAGPGEGASDAGAGVTPPVGHPTAPSSEGCTCGQGPTGAFAVWFLALALVRRRRLA